MSEKIVQLNEEIIKGQIKELVRGSVEETLNELLEKEAESLTQAARYERSEARQGYRSGHYDRNLTTTSGDVTLHMPRLKGVSFETAIIERYRRRESSVEEALIEMYLAGVSVRRVEDITEALWGSKVSPATISELNKKAYVHIEDWRNRPLRGGRYPYVYVDGIYLRRNWGGEYENVAILVAIAVNEDGFREVLGAAEGMKEDKASWVSFFQWLHGRGLDGVKLIVGDKCMGMLEAVGEVFPDAKYQRCTVHFYRNVFSVVPKSKVKIVAKMLKAIHAQESKKASREKAKAVVAELRAMKLKEAAKKVEDGIEETLTYCDFPSEHWTRIRTNNVIERLNREIRRRTRVVGTFPDGNSALMLVCARLRHVAGTQWGSKKYMNMKHLEAALDDASTLTAVDGICQQQVVVADLENIAVIIAAFQEAPVPAVLMIAVTELRNADTFPVITAEMRNLVHVQRILQGAKGVGGYRIFLLEVYLTKPPLQAFVTNIVTFSFADHREQWLVDLSIRQQRAGQQRKVFRLHGVLQGNAGSGDNDGPAR